MTCWSPEQAGELRRRTHRLAGQLANLYFLSEAEVSVVLRGGTSLGNYQAGFLYYISEFLKVRNESFRGSQVRPRRGFATVTGASAGGINALVSAIDGCQEREPDPEQSLYFLGWTRVGMLGRHGRSGFVIDGRESETPLGVLTQRPLTDASSLVLKRAFEKKKFVGSCEQTDLGITVTRLAPEKFPIHSKRGSDSPSEGAGDLEHVLLAHKQAEKFLFRFEFEETPEILPPGDPAFRIHAVQPYIPFEDPAKGEDPRAATRSFYLVLGDGYESSSEIANHEFGLNELIPVINATSSFPIAFPPEELTYTRVDRFGEPTQSESALFVDGGIFDNTPLGLAITIDRWHDDERAEELYHGGGASAQPSVAAWLDPAERSCLTSRQDELADMLCDVLPLNPRDYLFVEPTVVDWSTKSDRETGESREGANRKKQDLLPTVLKFAGSFLGTSMGAALVDTAQSNPFVIERPADTNLPRLLVPERHLPLTSRRLSNFMGFFEEDFRIYDFYVGLLDAERFVTRDSVYGASDEFPVVESAKYRCMRDYYHNMSNIVDVTISNHDLPESCFEPEPRAVRMVLKNVKDWAQLREEVISRVDEDWDQSEPDQRKVALLKAAEQRLSRENFRSLIVAMHNYKIWMMSEEYRPKDEFPKFFEMLDEAGFRFVDMQRMRSNPWLKIESAERARLVVRDLLQKGVRQLSNAQDDASQEVAVYLLGGIGADFYEPRPSWAHLSIGLNFNGVESYCGWSPDIWRRIRLDVGGRLYRLGFVYYTDADNNEKQRFFGSDAAGFVRTSFAILAKPILQLDVGLGFIGSELFSWDSGDKSAHVGFRYGPEFTGSIVVMRHIYIDAQFDLFLDGCGAQFDSIPDDHCPFNRRDYAYGEVSIFINDWRFSLGVGWRFML